MKIKSSLVVFLVLNFSQSHLAWAATAAEANEKAALNPLASVAASMKAMMAPTTAPAGGRGAPGGGGGNRGGAPAGRGGSRPAPQPVRSAPQPVRPVSAPQPVRPAPQPGRPGPQPGRPSGPQQPIHSAPQPGRPSGPQQPGRPGPQPGRPVPAPQPGRGGEPGRGSEPGRGEPGRGEPGRGAPGYGRPGDGGGRRVYEPTPIRNGEYYGPRWEHPYFERPVYNYDWDRLISVTCTAMDSYGDQYPVTENDYTAGYYYQQTLENIEDAALDRCFDESNGDAGCRLLGCNPGY